jgi:surfactin synthase thioesterase subunit
MTINWFLETVRQRPALCRLACLPYAGGGAAVFRGWDSLVGPGMDVLATQLPGRGWRMRERPEADLGTLADSVADALEPLADVPLAVFGHSMGAWLGLEVVRRLEARGVHPICLFASGRRAPSLNSDEAPFSHLPDAAFVAEIQSRYGGIPAEIAADPEILGLLLPTLRADIRALEEYAFEAAPITTPIVAMGGMSDARVPVADLAAWADETTGGFDLVTLPGGHFYFQDSGIDTGRFIRRRMVASALATTCP